MDGRSFQPQVGVFCRKQQPQDATTLAQLDHDSSCHRSIAALPTLLRHVYRTASGFRRLRQSVLNNTSHITTNTILQSRHHLAR
jgi:hypothetical protein